MGKARAEIHIDRSPDDVWAVVGDFGSIDRWMPGVESCVVDGDDRLIDMYGMKITEGLQSRDESARVLVYRIVGGIPLVNHEAIITVSPDQGGSRVTWDVEVEPDDMLDVMHQAYQQALQSLAEHLAT